MNNTGTLASAKTVFFNNELRKALPISLKQFVIKNYHGIKNTALSDIPVDTQWIFLAGRNGFGKTLLLQALALGLYGDKDENTRLVTDEDCSIAVEINMEGKSWFKQLGAANTDSFSKFVAYGPSRLEIQSPQSMNSKTGKSRRLYSLFNTDGLLLNIELQLCLWYHKKDRRFEIVKAVFLKVLPSLHDIIIMADEVRYIERDMDGNENYDPIDFSQLASSHKCTISMI